MQSIQNKACVLFVKKIKKTQDCSADTCPVWTALGTVLLSELAAKDKGETPACSSGRKQAVCSTCISPQQENKAESPH